MFSNNEQCCCCHNGLKRQQPRRFFATAEEVAVARAIKEYYPLRFGRFPTVSERRLLEERALGNLSIPGTCLCSHCRN